MLTVWAGNDALYVAATAGAAELMDFAGWGMKLIDPAVAVFGIDSEVVVDPISQTPMIVPIGRHHRAGVAEVAR